MQIHNKKVCDAPNDKQKIDSSAGEAQADAVETKHKLHNIIIGACSVGFCVPNVAFGDFLSPDESWIFLLFYCQQ